MESMTGNLCAAKGCTTDATIFRSVDVESMAKELESFGYDRYGYHRLFNGITGEYIDSLIFMGPVYYQKLQKFVLDTLYSISSGPTDALTHQLLDGGRASQGGLRIGKSILPKANSNICLVLSFLYVRVMMRNTSIAGNS
jgi:DNA-directed RNA polymerase II subunit RPB2